MSNQINYSLLKYQSFNGVGDNKRKEQASKADALQSKEADVKDVKKIISDLSVGKTTAKEAIEAMKEVSGKDVASGYGGKVIAKSTAKDLKTNDIRYEKTYTIITNSKDVNITNKSEISKTSANGVKADGTSSAGGACGTEKTANLEALENNNSKNQITATEYIEYKEETITSITTNEELINKFFTKHVSQDGTVVFYVPKEGTTLHGFKANVVYEKNLKTAELIAKNSNLTKLLEYNGASEQATSEDCMQVLKILLLKTYDKAEEYSVQDLGEMLVNALEYGAVNSYVEAKNDLFNLSTETIGTYLLSLEAGDLITVDGLREALVQTIYDRNNPYGDINNTSAEEKRYTSYQEALKIKEAQAEILKSAEQMADALISADNFEQSPLVKALITYLSNISGADSEYILEALGNGYLKVQDENTANDVGIRRLGPGCDDTYFQLALGMVFSDNKGEAYDIYIKTMEAERQALFIAFDAYYEFTYSNADFTYSALGYKGTVSCIPVLAQIDAVIDQTVHMYEIIKDPDAYAETWCNGHYPIGECFKDSETGKVSNWAAAICILEETVFNIVQFFNAGDVTAALKNSSRIGKILNKCINALCKVFGGGWAEQLVEKIPTAALPFVKQLVLMLKKTAGVAGGVDTWDALWAKLSARERNFSTGNSSNPSSKKDGANPDVDALRQGNDYSVIENFYNGAPDYENTHYNPDFDDAIWTAQDYAKGIYAYTSGDGTPVILDDEGLPTKPGIYNSYTREEYGENEARPSTDFAAVDEYGRTVIYKEDYKLVLDGQVQIDENGLATVYSYGDEEGSVYFDKECEATITGTKLNIFDIYERDDKGNVIGLDIEAIRANCKDEAEFLQFMSNVQILNENDSQYVIQYLQSHGDYSLESLNDALNNINSKAGSYFIHLYDSGAINMTELSAALFGTKSYAFQDWATHVGGQLEGMSKPDYDSLGFLEDQSDVCQRSDYSAYKQAVMEETQSMHKQGDGGGVGTWMDWYSGGTASFQTVFNDMGTVSIIDKNEQKYNQAVELFYQSIKAEWLRRQVLDSTSDNLSEINNFNYNNQTESVDATNLFNNLRITN